MWYLFLLVLLGEISTYNAAGDETHQDKDFNPSSFHPSEDVTSSSFSRTPSSIYTSLATATPNPYFETCEIVEINGYLQEVRRKQVMLDYFNVSYYS